MSVTSKTKQLAKLRRKAYRDAYVEEHIKTSLPIQMIALREQRGWSQTELGRRVGMRQNAVSRLEDAESGVPSVTTLLRLAKTFDVALLIKFVPFTKLLAEFSDLSTQALEVKSFEDELPELEESLAMPTSYYRGSYIPRAIYTAPQGLYAVDAGWLRGRSATVGNAEIIGLSPIFRALLAGTQTEASEVGEEMPMIDYTEEVDPISTQSIETYKSIFPSVFVRGGSTQPVN